MEPVFIDFKYQHQIILAGKDQITLTYHGNLSGLQMGRPVKNVENLSNVNVKE